MGISNQFGKVFQRIAGRFSCSETRGTDINSICAGLYGGFGNREVTGRRQDVQSTVDS
jgi:hypothetical protein